MKTRVLNILKPKIKDLGFKEEDLAEAIESIANGLNPEATDEDIEAKVNLVVPFLKVSQKAVTRIVNATPKPTPTPTPQPQPQPQPSPTPEDPFEKFKAWQEEQDKKHKEEIDTLKKQVTDLTAKDLLKNRTAKFTELLANLPEKQKASQLKDFNRVAGTFKDDAEFDAYIAEKKTDIEGLVQEMTDAGMVQTPPGGGTGGSGDKNEFAEAIEAGTKKIVEGKSGK